MKNIKRAILEYFKLRVIGISFWQIYLLVANENLKTVKFLGNKIIINSSFWYLHGLNELFVEETYRFNSENPRPKIIDCGSNIGLSTIYFKSIFPNSEIIAFEPDKDIFNILKYNLKSFNIKDVNLFNCAVWKEDGFINFNALGGVGGRIDRDKRCDTASKIPCVRLKNLLINKVEFLKIDIEGAEYDVIRDCSENLVNVENIFIEYHSMLVDEQTLDEILIILKKAGFKYYIKEAWNNQPFPYVNKRESLFDLQLNIFGYRVKK